MWRIYIKNNLSGEQNDTFLHYIPDFTKAHIRLFPEWKRSHDQSLSTKLFSFFFFCFLRHRPSVLWRLVLGLRGKLLSSKRLRFVSVIVPSSVRYRRRRRVNVSDLWQEKVHRHQNGSIHCSLCPGSCKSQSQQLKKEREKRSIGLKNLDWKWFLILPLWKIGESHLNSMASFEVLSSIN